jgi:hypothetical protein
VSSPSTAFLAHAYASAVGKGEEDVKKVRKPAKVIPLTERRREAVDLAKFIDAHGGKLGAFRGYGVRPPTPLTAPPFAPRA